MNYYRNEIYTVVPGDSLWKIANMYQVGLSELMNENPQILNPNLIYIGQQINIPIVKEYRQKELEIIRLVNQERAQRNLNPLRENWEVSRVARIKSQDMINNISKTSHGGCYYFENGKVIKELSMGKEGFLIIDL